MHLFTLLTTALATAVSATEIVERTTINARDTGVTFYDGTYFNTPIFTIPNLDECFTPPDEFVNKASSISFEGHDIKCDLYKASDCQTQFRIFQGLWGGIADLRGFRIDNVIASVNCTTR
ncbi:hypothetical protein V494_05412 [Pseudogymnoascus sp. VKM F-4513 (FW-928)]|nr:hypothetical protein V494_05412 [Pseudogymnoascus sp. VKM F-4513 (FW-928)]